MAAHTPIKRTQTAAAIFTAGSFIIEQYRDGKAGSLKPFALEPACESEPGAIIPALAKMREDGCRRFYRRDRLQQS